MQYKEWYPNGYGASIIRTMYYYGTEIAVLTYDKDTELYEDGTPKEWSICYDSELTEDTIGHVQDVDAVLQQIKDLPSRWEE